MTYAISSGAPRATAFSRNTDSSGCRGNTKAEPWIHYHSVLVLPGWSEDRLAEEVGRRNVKALSFALKNGRPNKGFDCSVLGCESKGPAYPVHSYEIVYGGARGNRAFGIQRTLWGFCKKCMEAAVK